MPTYTTTYSLGKPVVGADEDAWGDTLNTSLDAIDDILDGTTPVTGIDINSGTLDGVTIGGTTAGAGTFTTLTATTSITGTLATAAQPNVTSLGTLTSLTVSGDVSFGDNDKAIFGAGSDLQIYHSGAASFISDQGTGNLKVLAQDFAVNNPADTANMITAAVGGAVTAFYDGGVKLATTSTGIDVTGTVTADGLTVDGDASVAGTVGVIADSGTIQTGKDSSSTRSHLIMNNPTGQVSKWDTNSSNLLHLVSGDYRLYTNGAKAFEVDSNGDISFYEDTGTTAKFFWDASAESLGLGATSFAGEALRMERSGDMILGLFSGAANGTYLNMGTTANRDIGQISYTQSTNHMSFRTNDAERMRIDSSGNLLVGKTSDSFSTQGQVFAAGGYTDLTRAGTVLNVNRLTSDGDIVKFYKDGTTVGSIGVYSGDITVGNGDVGLIFNDAVGLISPWDMTANAVEDNAIDLGYSAGRFKDLYLSGGLRGDTLTFSSLAGSERMRIDSSGNLLVGVTSIPDGTNEGMAWANTGDKSLKIGTSSTVGDYQIRFYNGNGNVGNIITSGSATSYNTSSDHRLKENVVDLTGATARLKQLEPKRFNFIADADTTVDGFLAHEVQSVVPEAITGTHNEVDADGNPVYQGIDQSKLVPLLVATIKELEARITALEGE